MYKKAHDYAETWQEEIFTTGAHAERQDHLFD